MSEDKFIFSAGIKKNLMIILGVGVILTIIGAMLVSGGGHGHGAEMEQAGEHFSWIQRLWTNLWLNNVFFAGIGLIGVFFVAINYAAQAGWSAYIKRIPEAFGAWLPISGILMVILFFVINYTGHFHMFHWLNPELYDKSSEHYDKILAGKRIYLNVPFFLTRMIAYFLLWYVMYWWLRKTSLQEDIYGGDVYWRKMRKISTFFLVIFAFTSVGAAWDWMMTITPHWRSTLFGWYAFASWFVAGLAAITLLIVWLFERGYLKQLNSSHLHNMGLFMFAFSIFWTYLWFAQFLLYYYANIPEESVYFVERLHSSKYAWMFYADFIFNFFVPFLVLMTRASKRHTIFLKLIGTIILIGHWIDFYLMVTPGSIAGNGGFGFMEIGVTTIYISIFLFVVLTSLAKAPLVARNHPMLEESLHHHI